MTIQQYLNETEHASQSLIESIWTDFERAEKLKEEIQKESAVVENEYNHAIAMQMYAEDPDDVMLGVGRYWENYFGRDKELYHENEKLTSLTSLLAAREHSFMILSASLLESAKRGLSLVYGKPKDWPSGKAIGSENLSNIILQARNQSAHIDEAISDGKYKNDKITNCFVELQNIDPVFSDFTTRDMSFEIIKFMQWTNLQSYSEEMLNIK